MKLDSHISDMVSWSESLGLLTAAEEKICAENKTETNLWKLVNHNYKLILHIGKNILSDPRTDSEDVFSAGIEGLLHAAHKYDGRGRFSTYAAWWLKNKMLEAAYGKRGGEQELPTIDIDLFRSEDGEELGMDGLAADDEGWDEAERIGEIRQSLESYQDHVKMHTGEDGWRVYELRVGYGHSYERIAEYTGLPVRKVRELLDRAALSLKPFTAAGVQTLFM